MLIPRFSLSQSATHLSIVIRCPYVKLSRSSDDSDEGVQVDLVSPNEFYFACKPYHLHLFLPGRVLDPNSNGQSSQYKYDVDTSSFHLTYVKETPNEHFHNLEMMTQLLHKENKSKTIEEINRQSNNEEEEEDEDEPLWNQMRQLDIQDQTEKCSSLSRPHYGFNHQYSEIFSHLDSEYSLIFDNHSPSTLPTSSIRSSRLAQEQVDFNLDHYLADKYEDNDENYVLNIPEELNDQDRDDLKDLKYKELLIDDETEKLSIYLGLVDLLYAFVYDQHVTQGEPCCESPWNLHKLSSTLSWFDSFTDLPSVLISCCRRTLIYPLVRSLSLAKRCLLDVARIISLGKLPILICLLQMRRLFLDEEHRYLLNTLYLNDYCLWIQSSNGCQTNWLQSLAQAIRDTQDNLLNDENNLGLELKEKAFSWKVTLCQISDEDEDDQPSSSSEEEHSK